MAYPNRIRLIFAAAVLLALAPTARAAAPATLADALRGVPPDRLLELKLGNGDLVRGYPVTVLRDSFRLRPDAEGAVVADYALADIATVNAWRTNAGRGAGIGAISGGVVVGAFGLLLGSYLTTINDTGDSDVAPILALTLLGAGAGAGAGALLGGGMGALVTSWQQLWPATGADPPPERSPHAESTRLGLFAGVARSLLDGYEVTRFSGRVGLHRDLGRNMSLGPEVSWDDFDGSQPAQGRNGIYVSGKDSILKFGVTADLRSSRPGLSPYATTGIGWFISNDAYPGAHVGGGLQRRTARGADLSLDMRYHFSLTDVAASQVDRYWTIGMRVGFGL